MPRRKPEEWVDPLEANMRRELARLHEEQQRGQRLDRWAAIAARIGFLAMAAGSLWRWLLA